MSIICCRIAALSKPTGSKMQSSSSSTRASSSSVVFLFFLKIGISLPGHFFMAAALTVFFLRKQNLKVSVDKHVEGMKMLAC
jgi:hypothetical protein